MDMNQCQPGDMLLLRNSKVAIYICKFNRSHIIRLEETYNEVYRTDEGYMVSGQPNAYDVVSILDIKSLLKEAFDAGCEYVGERNFIDSEGYMDFHEDYEIEAPNFEKWIKNNEFKIDLIK